MKKKDEGIKSLFAFNIGGVSGAVILDIRRAKDGELYPVKYRITYKSKAIYYASGYSFNKETWIKLPDTKTRELTEKKALIKGGFDKIEAFVKELIKLDIFSFETLNNRLGKGIQSDVFSLFNSKVEKLKNEGKIGTSEWYYYSSQSLLKFLNNDRVLDRKKKKTDKPVEYAINTLKFSDVTPDFLKKYEKWLLECDKKYTSISMFIRALQAIFNDAKQLNLITEGLYPFGKGKYERPEGEGRKMALDMNQMRDLKNIPLVEDLERSRDLFFFSYFANGININDLLRLKFSNIVDGEICYFRAKTLSKSRKKTEIKIVLLPEMRQIIEKWGNEPNKDSYIFPFFHDPITPIEEKRITKNLIKLMNDHLKKMGKSVGIDNISTYTARHSFATILKRSGANIAYIAESLGHSNIKTTENYLASFEKDERIKNANLLANFDAVANN